MVRSAWWWWGLAPMAASAGTLDLQHQVRLVGAGGELAQGPHPVAVRLMTDATPGAPDVVCHETDFGPVAFQDGYATLILADVPSGCFSSDVWLATSVDGVELAPRQPVRDVPIAGVARSVPARATPGSCGSPGDVVYDTSVAALLVCDGATWQRTSTGAFPTDTSGTTTCSTPGAVRFTGDEFQGCAGGSWVLLGGTAAAEYTVAFSAIQADQLFTVPSDVSSIQVELWGAGGGGGAPGGWTEGFVGGGGGYTSASIAVIPNERLVVVVGEGGEYNFPSRLAPNYGGGGGYGTSSDNRYGAGGGGRTAIRRGTEELATAGGGGGGGSRHSGGGAGSNAGGGGGGTVGQDGFQSSNTPARGGSQSAGGAGGVGGNANGQGGAAFTGGRVGVNSYGGGGGGGFYGGGGGGYHEPGVMGGGAGGSGYISGPGVTGAVTTGASGQLPPNRTDPDYAPGIGVGGSVAGAGGDGLAVIKYASRATPPTPPTKRVFTYNGSDQSFVVPTGVTQIRIKAWGAGGGGGAPGGWTEGFVGGAGGYTDAFLPVTPGESLTVMVGERGAYQFPNGTSPGYGGGGGYASSSDNRYGASGGGRSAVRRGTTDLVVAGGGGGGGSRHSGAPGGVNEGGAGGGPAGEPGYQTANTPAGGGTQSAGGAGGAGANAAGQSGAAGVGGRVGSNSYGGGGGGGRFGGGGGGYHEPGTMGGGAGGSGYVHPTATWGGTQTGWRNIPPALRDPDYASGVGVGGPIGGTGGHGLVVVSY
jgi:hypothetical protein